MAEKITITTTFDAYPSLEAVTKEERDLLIRARDVSQQAYAPYSAFRVGAAVRLANGQVVVGNNQENAAFPASVCAERVALLAAAAQFPQVPALAIAIYAEPENYQLEHPPTPCGTCRQVMAECEQRGGEQMRVLLLAGSGKIYALPDARSLLPMGFSEDRLKRI